MLRKNEDELVVEKNGFIDALMKMVADLEIFGSIPATNVILLQIIVKLFCEYSILIGIANETRVVERLC